MEFLWTKEIDAPKFPALDGDRETEVAIIGGGMAGVLCAHKLQSRGVDCLLLEGKTLGCGITRGTTAVLSAQHDILYQDMIRQIGFEKARLYLQANLQAVEEYRTRANDCDFEELPSIMVSQTEKWGLAREAEAVRSLGFGAEFTTEFAVPITGGVRFPHMAQFHPLKFLYQTAKGNIFENTFVQNLEGTTAVTEKGRVRAKKVIVATHFPFLNRRGMYFMKLYQKRSYVLAYENAPQLGCTSSDLANDGVSLRNYGDLLLISGGECRTGKDNGGFSVARDFAKRHFPQAREVLSWTNQDCVSLDGIPYIGQYSASMPDVYVATGFGLWGMTTSMVAANILADLVQGKENPYAKVFSPQRSMLKKQLAVNLGSTLLHFGTPFGKRCPHMGCKLKWNSAEQCWDCPCHGSQFEANGRLIHNPAKRSMK